MSPDVLVRRLTQADASAYRAVRLRALREHPEAFTSDADEEASQPLDVMAQRLGHPERKVWGAFAADALMGTIGLDREHRVKNRHKATVVGMYVATEYAGKGAGRALINTLLADARATGLDLLVLTVTEGNLSAIRLYEHAGFKTFGVEPGAIKVAGRAWAKTHMYLQFKTP
mgnify:FL=1